MLAQPNRLKPLSALPNLRSLGRSSPATCVGASACDGFWVSLNPWEVCLGLGWTMAEGVNGVFT